MWQYSRVDHLSPDAVCFFCRRALKSSKGIVISDGSQEAYAGPNCAKKMLGPPEVRLLDVAHLALLVVSDEDPSSPTSEFSAGGKRSLPQLGVDTAQAAITRQPLPPLDRVIQYLRFRIEFMSNFQYHRSKILIEAHECYFRTGQLDEVNLRRVAGTIRNAREQNTVFSEDNVKHCIGINYWLHELLEHTKPDRREFLLSMLYKLHRQWSLSTAQLNAVNNWGAALRKRLHSFPHLDPDVFAGVRVPDFMQSKKRGRSDAV